MVELVQLEDHDPSIQVDESWSEEVRTRGGIKNGKGGGRKNLKRARKEVPHPRGQHWILATYLPRPRVDPELIKERNKRSSSL